ncbi:MAG: cell division protein ZapA [Deltaproteobacteria bacterium]|nr:cell division protein ZapA [Deltaproteobacteria bacterium]MBW2135977.1 cell division protein ZapA [Deltaproteobacteria bacterium]
MNSIKVKIFDYEYKLKSDESEEYVQKIAQYVNEKLEEIKESTEGLSEKKMAILVALHIASDYFKAIKERDQVRDRVKERASDLIERIDSVMTAG